MKQNDIENLFEKLEDSFDVYETPKGHQKRFLNKLNTTNKKQVLSKLKWLKTVSIAAIFAIIFSAGSFLLTKEEAKTGLASVSPKMEQTQSFFTATISEELEKLNNFNDTKSKVLVQDALKQLKNIETRYNQLKTDLIESGNNKRVIYAMINNFQNRIDLLEQVILKLEKIKKIKSNKNENIL
jgi:septal ring factor EnvC (AmiA/AmiB activator)